MAIHKATKQALNYLLGVCVPSNKQNAAKIRIQRFDFDKHLLAYFKKHEFIYASDPSKCCRTGDTVLIQTLPVKLTRIITHQVVEVVYPLGDITDPVTGKRIVSGRYREDINKDAELFGELKSKFEYSKASPRGVTLGVRDFSDKEIHVKHTDVPDEADPYAVNPS